MENGSIIKKGLTVAIILLFIGVAFAPSINASPVEDDLVEFDVEFCGLGKKHTVKLTQQEADEVGLFFDEIHERLNEVETREEAEEIFKKAVVELDKYGLLGGLSVKQAQELINGKYIKSDTNKIYDRLQKNILFLEDDVNLLCLLAGRTNGTFFCGPIGVMFNTIGSFIFWFLAILGPMLLPVMPLVLINTMYNPLMIFNMITYGAFPGFGGDISSADGWVSTYGLNGNINWKTPIFGRLLRFPIFLYLALAYPGVTGFTGIKLLIDYESFYLGFALIVRLGPEPLYNIWE